MTSTPNTKPPQDIDVEAPPRTTITKLDHLRLSVTATTMGGVITIKGPDGSIVIDQYAALNLCDQLAREIARAGKMRDQLIETKRVEAESLADEAAERDAKQLAARGATTTN